MRAELAMDVGSGSAENGASFPERNKLILSLRLQKENMSGEGISFAFIPSGEGSNKADVFKLPIKCLKMFNSVVLELLLKSVRSHD